MFLNLVVCVTLFVYAVDARPGVYRYEVDGNECEWPWCKFCPNEHLWLLCELCPVKPTPAQPDGPTQTVEKATTPAVEIPSELPQTDTPASEAPKNGGIQLKISENFDWPWCKYCSEIDLGLLCKLCNCSFGKPHSITVPPSTPIPEVPSEQPSVSSETKAPNTLESKYLNPKIDASKEEIIHKLKDCDWPWCKFCPNDRLGFLCKLCPVKTTPAQPETTTSNNNPTKLPNEPSDAPVTEEPKIFLAENFEFPWCKYCSDFDLGFLCTLCNCTVGISKTTPVPDQPSEKPSEEPKTEPPANREQNNMSGPNEDYLKHVKYEKLRKQYRNMLAHRRQSLYRDN